MIHSALKGQKGVAHPVSPYSIRNSKSFIWICVSFK